MPFNGTGTFSPAVTYVDGTTATAAGQNSQDTDIAAGLTNCVTRDGQSPATANIPFGGFKATGLANAASAQDAVTLAQVQALIQSLVPPGFMLPHAGTAAPTGWVVCDGTSYATAAQPALFAAIGYTWGGAGANFNVPNLIGKTVIGLDTAGTTVSFATAVGAAGGAQSVALTTPQIPAHNHPVVVADPGHSHTPSLGGNFVLLEDGSAALAFGTHGRTTTATAANTTGITATTSNTGGAGSHSNVQPSATGLWCIKT